MDTYAARRCSGVIAAFAMLFGALPASAEPYLPAIQHGTIAINLQAVATGMSAPDYAISAPNDPRRLYVLEQNGLIRVIQDGSLLPGAALDLRGRVSPPLNAGNPNDERGLLGIAFHPGYADPGSPGYRTLYTYTSEPIPAGVTPTYPAPNNVVQNYMNVISEWRGTDDPNAFDPDSRRELISFGKNAGNHNGGPIAFGPDGYLYLATGDGGNANDVGPSHIEPGGNAQSLATAMGKMLRIDPLRPALTPGSADPTSANGQYRIPQSNPFQGPGEVPEIYALGFRNPYRFAFDTLSGDLILADVGQNNIEEINRVMLGGNYGWAIKEGEWLFNRATGSIGSPAPGNHSPGVPDGLIDPISGPGGTLQYDHGDGISITGGFVYRGAAIPELYGKYVFGDLAIRGQPTRVDGRLFYADLTEGTIFEFRLPGFATDQHPNGQLPNGLTVHGFGQDDAGELYAVVTNSPANGSGGIVYKLAAIPEPGGALVALPAVAVMAARRTTRRVKR